MTRKIIGKIIGKIITVLVAVRMLMTSNQTWLDVISAWTGCVATHPSRLLP